MKILPLADLHIEFSASLDTATPTTLEEQDAMSAAGRQADVVVLAGDTYTKGRGSEIASKMFPGKQVVMVAGNHEYYGQGYPVHTSRLKNKAEEHGIHFLENRVVEIDDVVFLG